MFRELKHLKSNFDVRVQELKRLEMWNYSYSQRLDDLGLKSLELRRLEMDMILVYKIIHGLVDLNFYEFFELKASTTRGNNLALFKTRASKDIRKYFFCCRVVDIWNSLPNDIVEAKGLHDFRFKIKTHNFSRFLKGRGLDVSG